MEPKVYVKKGKSQFPFFYCTCYQKSKKNLEKEEQTLLVQNPYQNTTKHFTNWKSTFKYSYTSENTKYRYVKYHRIHYIPVTNWLSFLYHTMSALGLAFATLQVSSTSSFSRIFTRLPAEWPTISMEVGGTGKIHQTSCNDESFQNTALYSSKNVFESVSKWWMVAWDLDLKQATKIVVQIKLSFVSSKYSYQQANYAARIACLSSILLAKIKSFQA